MDSSLTQVTGLDHWDDVRICLPAGSTAHDRQCHVVLQRVAADALLITGPPGTWSPRHRRGLHRLDFRVQQAEGNVAWQWQAPPPVVEAAVRRMTPPGGIPPAQGSRLHGVRAWVALDELVVDQAVRALRDVFGCSPADLRLLVPRDDVLWDHDDGDDDLWPDDPCDDELGPCPDCADSRDASGGTA